MGSRPHPAAPDPTGAGRLLWRATVATLVFAALEAAGGYWTGSLALLSDAGHMLTDGAALALGAAAAWIARPHR